MWCPPRKYKGHRTQHVHAIKVTLKVPERVKGRSMLSQAYQSHSTVRLVEMEEWCEENCSHNWSSFGYATWYFDKPQEAVMFKMMFGGK